MTGLRQCFAETLEEAGWRRSVAAHRIPGISPPTARPSRCPQQLSAAPSGETLT